MKFISWNVNGLRAVVTKGFEEFFKDFERLNIDKPEIVAKATEHIPEMLEYAKQIVENGFGYDPIFYVPEFHKTTAELTEEEKNQVSHRGKALRLMKEELKTCESIDC